MKWALPFLIIIGLSAYGEWPAVEAETASLVQHDTEIDPDIHLHEATVSDWLSATDAQQNQAIVRWLRSIRPRATEAEITSLRDCIGGLALATEAEASFRRVPDNQIGLEPVQPIAIVCVQRRGW